MTPLERALRDVADAQPSAEQRRAYHALGAYLGVCGCVCVTCGRGYSCGDYAPVDDINLCTDRDHRGEGRCV